MTPTAPSLGLVVVPTLPPELLPGIARACDAHLDEVWVWEDCFAQGGIASAAVALGATERVRVGLGIMPTPLRNVALTAMEVATLARTHPGRFLPGVGHGVQEWMEQVGGRAASPLTLLQEYAVALRRLLDGEEVTVEGRYVRLDRVRLTWPPSARLPLLLGGTGPRTLELCGRLGDEVILGNTHSPAEVASSRDHAAAGRAASGRSGPPPMVTTLIAATGPDARERIDAELPRWGVDRAPDRAAAGAAPDIAAAVRRLGERGATRVVIQPTLDEPDLLGFIAFLGTQVRPLLG